MIKRLIALFLIFALTGCTPPSNENDKEISSSNISTQNDNLSSSDYIDLTTLSSTMVYAEVYDMIFNPDNYIGKTVKMNGMFSLYNDVQTGNIYYACVISDATACCSQGVEFVLEDESIYNTLKVGDEITVSGEFQTYLENNTAYIHLVDAKII